MGEEFKFFEYDGMAFKLDRKASKLFRIGPGGKLSNIADLDRASKAISNSRTISEKEALSLAEE